MKYCPDCPSFIDEEDQTREEYEQGICPYCGGNDVREINEDQEER